MAIVASSLETSFVLNSPNQEVVQFEQSSYRVTGALGVAVGTEFISTGAGSVEAVLGVTFIQTDVTAKVPAVKLNTAGTGGAEGSSLGDIGLFSTTGVGEEFYVACIVKV